MRKKEIRKKDTNSHHRNNFLVCFSLSNSEIKKALVNASDKKNALRLALNRLCRLFPEIDISRARVSGVYPARVERIEKRIG